MRDAVNGDNSKWVHRAPKPYSPGGLGGGATGSHVAQRSVGGGRLPSSLCPHCAVAVRANVSMGCTKTTTGPEQEPWKDPLNSTHLGSSSPEARHSPWMVYLRGAQRLRINAAGRGGKEGLCFQPGEEKARRPAGGNCQTPKVQHMGR